MGHRLVSFNFIPEKNEQIDAIVKVPREPRSVIHGIVKNCKNELVKDAVVKLFKVNGCDPCNLEPITHTFTDECGQFLFGPLTPKQKYVIKVWIGDVKIRQLVIKPDKGDGCDDDNNGTCNCKEYFEEEEI